MFNEYGKKNDLTNYENILFLSESGSEIFTGGYKKKNLSIDAENNILSDGESVKNKETKLWELFGISENDLFLHNQKLHNNNDKLEHQNNESDENESDESGDTNKDINEESPTSNQYRSIFYESCRGLEAWSVMCFDLDLFYQRKYDEELAASYLSDDLFLTETQRREKYAITWVLMALTRPIDSLYIHLNMKLIGSIKNMDSKLKLRNILAEYAGYEIEGNHKAKHLKSSVDFQNDEDISISF